ncbi:glycosyl transferase [Lapidilactobacillus dextrinicus DSM 20335]|uniref:Glycosyl transferase n=1 Tax=Lapidilactobacillus dextrinicus DSM 20335 TaxID=1423738 RepID=A0A0R2BJ77_9LACO|nr:glycosyl transferase [Lapidilactobacillus dextrinicus DSM 20335]
MEVPEDLKGLYHQRKRWAKGGTEVWLTNFKLVFHQPIQNIGRTMLFVDQSLSIIWSLFFWFSSVVFIVKMMIAIGSGQWIAIDQLITTSAVFISFEMIAGILQLMASLIVDDRGRKLKYFLFAPFYMLFYWLINTLTILTTFIAAVKTILGQGTGTWVSPECHRD